MNKLYSKYLKIMDKFSNTKLAKFLPHSILLIVFLIIVIVMSLNDIRYNDVIVKKIVSEQYEPIPIYKEKVEYDLNTNKVDKFNCVAIYFGTYDRINHSNYKINIYKNNNKIFSKKINAKKIKNVKETNFKLKNQKVSKGDAYKVEIIPLNANENNSIAIFVDKETKTILRHNIKINSPNNIFVYTIFILMLLLFIFSTYIFNTKKIKEHKAFLILSIFFVIVGIITPPFQVPDEIHHFNQAYNLSQHNIIEIVSMKHVKKSTAKLPNNDDCIYEMLGETDNVREGKYVSECLNNGKLEKRKLDKLSVLPSSRPAYIFPAIVIKIAMLFTTSPLVLFILGRLANIIISLFLIYLSIKIIPFMKKTLLAISFIPMMIQQVASYSYDSLLLALCILLVSYILYLAYGKKKLNYKDYLIFIIILLMISLIKLPYALLGILIIIIPKDKFNNKKLKNKIITLLLCFIAFILIFYALKLFTAIKTPSVEESGAGMKQVYYLAKHPLFIIKVIVCTLNANLNFYLQTLIGRFGMLLIEFNNIYIIAYYVMLIALMFTGENKLNKGDRLLTFLVNAIIIGGIFLALYMGWTSYKATIVQGVQGRYFLQILLPIALVLQTKTKYLNITRENVYSFITIMSIAYVCTLLISFY